MSKNNSKSRTLSGKQVFFIFLGFFGVVFAVNAVFISKAISSFPGEITKKSYIQGINYNDTLESNRLQADLGWSAEIGISTDAVLISRFFDKEGTPLDGMQVQANLVHHSGDHENINLPMTNSADGEYSAPMTNLPSGRWTATIQAKSEDGSSFKANKELTIQLSP